MNIEIYGKDHCPYCDMAVAISETYDYVYKKLDKDFTREELFKKFPKARTFPQVTIDGKNIGGYTELKQYLESNT